MREQWTAAEDARRRAQADALLERSWEVPRMPLAPQPRPRFDVHSRDAALVVFLAVLVALLALSLTFGGRWAWDRYTSHGPCDDPFATARSCQVGQQPQMPAGGVVEDPLTPPTHP